MPESPPAATVPRIVRGEHRLRKARGFSLGELQQAGIHLSQTLSMHLRADRRRRTTHPHNVAALKEYMTSKNQITAMPLPPQEDEKKASEPSKESGSTLGKGKPKPRTARTRAKKQKA